MKKLIYLLFFLPLLSGAQQKPELAFTIHEKDFIPEGIAYNTVDKSFYVGSIHRRKIVKITSSGVVSDFVKSNQDSIGMVIGLRIDEANQHLWVCNNQGEGIVGGRAFVHQYDLTSGKLVMKYVIQGVGETHFFNDAVLANAHAYVSDSEFGAVYKIDPAKKSIELFYHDDKLYYPNGITTIPEPYRLVVSAGSGLVTIDLSTKEVSSIPFGKYYIVGIDGLYYYNKSLLGIQNVTYPISINRYYLNEKKDTITHADLLAVNDPAFDIPTTGAIAGDWFYFIANSHLSNYDKGTIKNPDLLQAVRIMKVRLK